MRRYLLLLLVAMGAASPAHAERLKDLADLTGARSNQLLGYGLVVGLPGTGDDIYSGIGAQSVATMLRQLGVNLDPNNLRLRNVAAVMVTAEMPAFVAPGQRIDVTVSSVGNARSLQGGTLIASPLKGVDLKVYAVAQGALSVGGYFAQGLTNSRLQKNITTVGRIPGGALVEREVPVSMPEDLLQVHLKAPDFTTAVRMAEAVDKELKIKNPNGPEPRVVLDPNAAPPSTAGAAAAPAAPAAPAATDPNAATGSTEPKPWATAKDSGTVEVYVPQPFVGKVPMLMALLEGIEVQPDWPSRVIINERTGTVVLGDQVRLAPVAIAHGGLTLEVREQPLVSQPGPFSSGTTQVVNSTQIIAQEQKAPLTAMNPGTSLGEVVKALNTLGVNPRDLLAILQALKTSGALRADLEIQ